jgi:hypothetical protein
MKTTLLIISSVTFGFLLGWSTAEAFKPNWYSLLQYHTENYHVVVGYNPNLHTIATRYEGDACIMTIKDYKDYLATKASLIDAAQTLK